MPATRTPTVTAPLEGPGLRSRLESLGAVQEELIAEIRRLRAPLSAVLRETPLTPAEDTEEGPGLAEVHPGDLIRRRPGDGSRLLVVDTVTDDTVEMRGARRHRAVADRGTGRALRINGRAVREPSDSWSYTRATVADRRRAAWLMVARAQMMCEWRLADAENAWPGRGGALLTIRLVESLAVTTSRALEQWEEASAA